MEDIKQSELSFRICRLCSRPDILQYLTYIYKFSSNPSILSNLRILLLQDPGSLPHIRFSIHQPLILTRWRHPLTTLPRLNLANIHCINLLQRLPLRLADKEINNKHRREITSRKHVPVFEFDSGSDEGRKERNQEIPRPIGRCDESHGARAVVRWEELADYAPDNRTPSYGVEADEEAGEDYHRRARLWGVLRGCIVKGERAYGGEDEEIDRHADTAYDERFTTSESLNDVETKERHTEIHTTEDHGRDEGVGESGGFENCGAIVEKEVSACQLLECLQRYAEHGSVCHSRAYEELDPWALAEGDLKIVLFFDLSDFAPYFTVCFGHACEFGHSCSCFVDASVPVGESRGFGECEDTEAKYQGPDEADGHGYPPASRIWARFGAEVDGVRGEYSECDEELVCADEGAADLAWGSFGDVHGYHDRQRADPGTGYETAYGYLLPACRGGYLDHHADDEDEGPECHGVFAANAVSDGGDD